MTNRFRPELNEKLVQKRDEWRQHKPRADQPDLPQRKLDSFNSDGSVKWRALSVDEMLDAIAELAEGEAT